MIVKNNWVKFLVLIFIVICGAWQNKQERQIKIFLLAGQSNMEGCGIVKYRPDSYATPPENVITWDAQNMKWSALETDSFAVKRDSLFGPEIGFSHLMAKAYPDCTIAIIKTAGGGTTLWKHWRQEGFMYKRFISNMENALQQLNESGAVYEVSGMLWMQGETDAEILEKAKEYELNLPVLINSVRKLTQKESLPFVMGRISSSLLKETPWNFDQTVYVQKSQENVAAKDSNVFIINTDHLTTWDDNTHFDARSQIWLGNEMGEIMMNRMNK